MILLRLVAVFQLVIATYKALGSLAQLFKKGDPYFALEALLYALIVALCAFTLRLINVNYPDKPVAGKQKTIFNRLYLVNFLLLAFIFALFFSQLRHLQLLSSLIGFRRIPFSFLVNPLIITFLLIFQLVLLYGLYTLRRVLFINFMKHKQFDFEQSQKTS